METHPQLKPWTLKVESVSPVGDTHQFAKRVTKKLHIWASPRSFPMGLVFWLVVIYICSLLDLLKKALITGLSRVE